MTILEHRKYLKQIPSLRIYFQEIAQEIYEDSRQINSPKTGLNENCFSPEPIATME